MTGSITLYVVNIGMGLGLIWTIVQECLPNWDKFGP